MRLEFAKLDGLGNDFVFIDNMDSSISLDDDQVKKLCDRHFGIGADGVILVQPSPREECAAYMHYINSDGSLAQMCGNGVRCFSKYLVDRGIVDAKDGSLIADTLAGPREIGFKVDDSGRLCEATVDMGEPILDPALVPAAIKANAVTDEGAEYVREAAVASPWGDFKFTCVSMGNPHAVCFIDDWAAVTDALFDDPSEKSLATLNIDLVGRFYESNPVFPEKSNIEFATVGPDGISMRVYERGCGETLACGTGTCATSVAATLTGRAPRGNTVHLLGGDLHIDWAGDNHVFMTGPASQSFTGIVEV